MPKHVGIVACSAEGAALCYRTFCSEAASLLGEHQHPVVSMFTFPLGEYMVHIKAGNWHNVAQLVLSSAEKLASIGADFVICPDNTIHQAFDIVLAQSPIPWLHIAEGVLSKAKDFGYNNLGITGTKYLMTGPVYREFMKDHGIQTQIPDEKDREKIDDIIFKELVYGNFLKESRQYFNRVILKLKDRGCDAVVLGCTEIPLLVNSDDCPLPVLDSTRLLAMFALNKAINTD